MNRRQRKLFRRQSLADPPKFKAPGDPKLLCPVIVNGFVPLAENGDNVRLPRCRPCEKRARRFVVNGYGLALCNMHANRLAKRGNIVTVERNED